MNKFLIAGLLSLGLLGCIAAEKPTRTTQQRQQETRDKQKPLQLENYTINELLDDTTSLEQLLENGKEKAPKTQRDYTEHKTDKASEFIVNYTRNKQGIIGKITIGSIFILNNEGYFITAYHVVDDLVENPEKTLTIVYDFENDFAASPIILAYSKDYDIALGKFAPKKGYKKPTTNITKNTIPYNKFLYCPRPDINATTELNGTEVVVLDQIAAKLPGAGIIIDLGTASIYVQKKPIRIEYLMEIYRGQAIEFLVDDEKEKTAKQKFILPFKVQQGQSGSAVLDGNNNLVGIVIQQMNLQRGRESLYVTRCTGPKPIREMIQIYIAMCKEANTTIYDLITPEEEGLLK